MTTPNIRQILKSARRLRKRTLSHLAGIYRSALALMLVPVLSSSLVLPLSVHAGNVSGPSKSKTKINTAASKPTTQSTETFAVYGPKRFTRENGQPVNVVENFSLPADAISPFTILIENGTPGGSNRVSSATIKLNGATLYQPNDFGQNVSTLTKNVNLTTANTLEVKLASAPGSFITVTFTATRATSQPTLSSVQPSNAIQGQTLSVTFHGSNTHWVATQTRASLGSEVAVGGAGYGEMGPVTVVDATTLIASVVVSPTAALDPRTARVVTPAIGSSPEETVTLSNAFTVSAATPPGASSSVVSTIAGMAGNRGFAEGNGSQALFKDLTSVAIGPDDAIYVADPGNQRIRVVRGQPGSGGTTVWTVSTLAGNGTAGFADGAPTTASFNNPQGVAVDAAGVVYVADTANNRIRRIATNGTVSTLAGDGTAGFQNGSGDQARFNAPQGVAIDSLGNVYVADTGNSAVRVINVNGVVSTVAGDGSIGSNDSPNARFDGLVGIAVEGQSIYVYLADTGNHRIRRLDVSGTVITIAGAERGFKDGSAAQARFAEPSGIAIDGAGKIIVADSANSLIRSVDPNQVTSGSPQSVFTVAGTGARGLTNGAGNVTRFFMPRGVAVSNSSALIVADTGNQVLRRILLPPIITSISPGSGRPGDSVTINGAQFDGRSPAGNVIRFTRSQQAGGGQTFGSVTQATRTAITVVVPADVATGPVTVQTEGGTATSPSDFVVDQFSAPVINDFNPKRGTPGTQVTLAGTNLKVNASDPQVTFAASSGRLSALVNSASATEVRVTVPNGAVTGLIQLTNAGGTAATATPFTVDTEQDFQLTVAPSTTTAVQGGAGTYVVYLTSAQSDFSQLAALTVTGLPSGITATFEPEQITAGASSTLTLQLSGTIGPGSYPLTIHGVASVGGHDLERIVGATLNVMASGQTTLSGRVMSTDREPIIGATASLDGRTAMTDAAGAFLLSGVTAGSNRPLMIDGRTASSPNRTYPVIIEPANLIAGQANVNPYTFYLPPIDTQYEVEVVPGQNTIASNPRVTGLQMTIPAGANLRNRDGSPVARVSITPLAIDRTPAPLPANIKTALVYTSQPGGAIADVAMPVVYPNLLGLNPNTQVQLYAFNHDTVQWYVYGTGRVSADGRTIAPEIDPSTGRPYGLKDFSWHFPNGGPGGNPGGPGGCGGTGPNPVNYSTGIKLETTIDIAFGGARGGLALTRYYSSDNSGLSFFGRFGRGIRDNYETTLAGSWSAGGSGRVIRPDEQTGRLFSYARTESDGTLIFTTTATIAQLGDVVRRLTNGTLEYKTVAGRVMHFDSGGRMTAMTDQNGNTTTLTYTGSRLTQVTDEVGRSITLGYENGSGFVDSATDPLGRVWHYTYGNAGGIAGFLLSVTDPLGHHTSYAYTNARLTSVTDANGNVVKTITYDSNARVIKQQFADGGFETYEYVVSGGVVTSTTITDQLGRKMTKRFNASGYILGSVDALGQSSQNTLDLTTNLATATLGPCGCPEETREFDARGNVTSATDQLGHTIRYEYEPAFNNVTKTTDKNGNVTTFQNDAHGNLTSYTNALNETVTFQIDADGQVTSVTDALGHEMRMEYDSMGNMTARVDSLGSRWVMEYDAVGRLTANVDPLGRRSVTEYDSLDRVKKITDASGAVTTFEYDSNSNQTKITDGLNHAWTMVYDAKNRLTSQTDPLGRATRMAYNSNDELVQVISPSGRKTLYEYDNRGQRTKITYPLGETARFGYDNRGNLARFIDQRGNITTWTYDEQFRPKAMRDPLGNLTSISYDSQNNVTTKVDKMGRQTTLSYDALNRIHQIAYPDAQVVYTYDHAGRVQAMSDTQGGEVSYTYDAANRPISETTAAGTVSYEYDRSNQRTSMTAANRLPVTFGYDSAGRLQTITQGTETFSLDYDVLSRRKTLTRPNGIVTSYEYNEVHRLTRLKHALGQQALEDYQYTYNSEDDISSITSLADGTMLSQPRNASTADPRNRISQFGDASYTFDDQGQVRTRTDGNGTTNYSWDARGRLTQTTLPSGQSLSYSYDVFGRRTSRTANGVATSFLYDGEEVVADQGSDGTATDYLNGINPDEKLRQTNSSTGALYFLQDHLGSTVALANGAGSIVEQTQYEAFGQSAGSSLTRYGYTGREREGANGLMYYRARWYDPQQGRFMSEDPIGLTAGPNLYEYAYDNPIKYVDPTGNQGWETAGALAGGGTLAGGSLAGGGTAAGAAIAAAAPPVAVAIAGAAAIYGAWKFGEWLADQPWNPLTHPAPPPAPATCRTRAAPRPNPIPIPMPPPALPSKPCPPCPAPPPPRIDRVPPSRPHFPCPGDHWHFFIYNQNPVSCQCYLQKKFGGCCGTPGAPC